jgi:hypothetical protein
MEPRIEPIKGGVAAVGPGWAVVAESEEEARQLFEVAQRRHEAIEARPDPHPYSTEPQRQSWQSPSGAQG